MGKKGACNPEPGRHSRIGLFGGTFNPVHIGHLRAMVEIREAFFLDQLIIIPAAMPPHKPHQEMADASDRMAMLTHALSGNGAFTLSDVEIKREGPSYSIDTIRYYKERVDLSDELYLIMGQDAFLEICTWRDYKALLQLIPIIVMSRPGAESFDQAKTGETVSEFLKRRISKEYQASAAAPSRFDHPKNPSVYVNVITSIDISSTQVRALVREGKSIRYLVPDPVADFIEQKGLYL